MRRLLIAVLLPALHVALDDECKDPLFQMHWQGKVGYFTKEAERLPSLNAFPTVKTGLKLCPQYNGKASCCNAEFEAEQHKYFNFIRSTVLPSKFVRIRAHMLSVQEVERSPAYKAAGHAEREQFRVVLERFPPVLEPSVQAECFTAILAYTAGMSCLACRSDWFRFVTLNEGQVVRVNIHPAVCMGLWGDCESFSNAAMALKQALLDSALAKQAKRQAEDLSMFSDQQTLCDWLHDEVGLHPFSWPSEAEREEVPRVDTEEEVLRDEDAEQPAPGSWLRPFLQEGQADHFDVLTEGVESGFDLRWQGQSSAARRAEATDLPQLLCLLAVLLPAIAVGGG